MPNLILTTEAQGKVAYEFSESSITIGRAPAGFGNASPFRRGSISRDPVQLMVLGIAAIAALAFLGSMVAVLLMRAP
jgi:hypothetical protein